MEGVGDCLRLKWDSAVNGRGAITVVIVVQDGECIGLSSVVIRIDKPTLFALIFSRRFVFFRQNRNRLLPLPRRTWSAYGY
jgi:hypothetical protein